MSSASGRWHRIPGILGILAAGLTLGGCSEGLVCTTSVEPGIVVAIRDARDGAPLAAGARGAVREGSYTDSLRPAVGTGEGVLLSRAAAFERPGTYVVTVAHPGYAAWERRGVRVLQGDCHVETVHLVADLDATP